jgi:hypothetical protein
VVAFAPLLGLLADVPDPRRAQGKLYTLPHVLLFSILAIVTGCNSCRGIGTFIDVHRQRLNTVFGLTWRRAPAHTAVRYILQGLDPAAVETAFRRHAALLQAARATPGQGTIALDGKTLRGSFDSFRDRAAAQVLSNTPIGSTGMPSKALSSELLPRLNCPSTATCSRAAASRAASASSRPMCEVCAGERSRTQKIACAIRSATGSTDRSAVAMPDMSACVTIRDSYVVEAERRR